MRASAARVAVVVLVTCFGGLARAQICSESQRCLHTIGSPGRFASIGAPHRMLFASGELVWPSFIDIHAIDLGTGRARTLPHCGTTISDLALEGSNVYTLADHAVLCRVSLTTPQATSQTIVSEDTIGGFAVSSAAIAYSRRRRGEQAEIRVAQWSNGRMQTFVTATTVEHMVVDATTLYWIDADYLVRASITAGTKTVGPRITNRVTRLQVDHGVVYVATDHDVLRLDSSGSSWIALAHEGAEDLAVDGSDVYWSSAARGKIMKLGMASPLSVNAKPYAIALDAASLLIAEEDPFVIRQIVPR